jgi:hypothetical protein
MRVWIELAALAKTGSRFAASCASPLRQRHRDRAVGAGHGQRMQTAAAAPNAHAGGGRKLIS